MAAMLGTFAALLLLFGGGLTYLRGKHRRLSRRRPNLDAPEFVRALPPGCDPIIGTWVYRQLDVYLPDYLKPHPTDRLFTDLAVDPDDYSDMGREHFARWSLPMPSRRDPEVLPDDPTVAAFIRYLTRRTQRT